MDGPIKQRLHKIFVLKISQYFHQKRNKNSIQTQTREAWTRPQVEDKSCSVNMTFGKLSNVIKNQINTYISSLFTCPLIESRRGWCIWSEKSSELYSTINLTICLCLMVDALASAYSAAISRTVWWQEQPSLQAYYSFGRCLEICKGYRNIKRSFLEKN